MNRWLALTSRIGTSLVAIGLALLLISLIPTGNSGSSQQSNTFIQANTYSSLFSQDFVTPQQITTLTVTSDRSINVYLLEVSSSTLFEWITMHYTTKTFFYDNVTYLKSFLGNFSQSIAYSQIGTLFFNHQYAPTKVTNVTLVVSNPSSSSATIQESASISQQVAPASKVATLADWSIPVGLVLAIPWFIDLYQRRARKSMAVTNVSA
jgi:hypothetical protein